MSKHTQRSARGAGEQDKASSPTKVRGQSLDGGPPNLSGAHLRTHCIHLGQERWKSPYLGSGAPRPTHLCSPGPRCRGGT